MDSSLSRRTFLAGTGALCGGVVAGSVSNRATATDVSPNALAASPSLEGLESFVDDELEELLDEHDIPGATVAVVHDGDLALAKGYGEADTEDGRSVVADETLFRVGSVSKPFVWTAVTQLIERGELDPHEDVSTYLETISVPDHESGEPITLAHLATHTAGFEERARGTWVRSADDVRPLEEVLDDGLPGRVRPPGAVVSYSNHGTALAAQVVADVTGTPFSEYVEEHVFEPLGMDRSTFAQPVPDDFVDDLATGYASPLGPQEAQEFEYLEIAPAGSMSATATDMARFMLAHLGDGAASGSSDDGGGAGDEDEIGNEEGAGDTDDARILEPDSVESMHERWFSHHEELEGLAFGWLERFHGERRLLWHNGSTPTFHSDMVLSPDDDLGLFVSFNSDGGPAARSAFVEAFLEEFLPAEEPEPLEPDGRPERADELEGSYRSVRTAETNAEKLTTAQQAATIEVSVDDDGALVTEIGESSRRWVELEPLLFREVDGHATMAFGEDDDGSITYLFEGFQAFERLAWYESGTFQTVLAAASALVVLSALLGWPLATAWRWRQGDPPGPPTPRRARWIAGAAGAAPVAFFVGLFALLVVHQHFLFSTPPLTYRLLFVLPLVGAGATLVAVVFAGLAWRERYWGLPGRIHYTLVTAALLAAYWLLAYWNQLALPF